MSAAKKVKQSCLLSRITAEERAKPFKTDLCADGGQVKEESSESSKVPVPDFVLQAEKRLFQSDFLRMNSDAGNTPYPEKRKTRSRVFSNSAPSQRNFGRQKTSGRELFQDRCPRGRGEFQNLSKKFSSDFDREKSERKRGRGRGTQLHGSSRPSAVSLSPISHATTAAVVDVAEPLTSSASYAHQLKKMNEQEIVDEVKWQIWKLQKEIDRVVSSLDAASVDNFEREMEKLLSGPIAEKLCELPDSISPLEVLVSFLVRQGISESVKLNLVVGGLELLMKGQCADGTCQALVKVMNKIVEEILQCGIDDGRRQCNLFSEFVSLLMANSTARKAEHRDDINSCVKQCFVTWSKCLGPSAIEQSKKIQVFCCDCLLSRISSHLSIFKDVLVELVEGPIRRSILNVEYPEDLREAWLSYAFRTLKCVYQDEDVLKTSPKDKEKPLSAGTVPDNGYKVHVGGASPVALAPIAGSDPKQQFELEPNQQQNMLLMQCFDQMRSEEAQLQINPSVVYSQVTGGNFGYLKPLAPSAPATQMSTSPPVAYARVTQILNALNLAEVLPKFKAAMIKDTVLEYGVEAVKGCLKDAGIPSGAILEITSYLQHFNKNHPTGHYTSSYPSAQQPHQIISPMTPQNYLPSHALPTHNSVPHFSAVQQQPQHHMLMDGRRMYNIPRMVESQPMSPSSPFPMIASPLTLNPSGSQVDRHHHHHQLLQQHQQQIHQQIVCRPAIDSSTEMMGAGKPMSPVPPFLNPPPAGQLDRHQLQCQSQPYQQIVCRPANGGNQEMLSSGISLGRPPSGQYGVVHTASTVPLGMNPAIVTSTTTPISDDATMVDPVAFLTRHSDDATLVEPVAFLTRHSDDATLVEPVAFSTRLSDDDKLPLMMPTGITASNIRPGGFGSFTCVICGGNDHATQSCLQRDKFFLHM